MSTTLTNGLKLPDKGSVDWYADMQNNYTILDNAVGAIADKASASHTHGNITNAGAIGSTSGLPVITGTDGILTTGTFGTASGTFCEGNDSRLSDARTPVAHTHTKSDVTDLLNSNFIPSANNSYDLGSSSYQWNNIYSKNYFYNGTQWGLDQANVWTNIQRMTCNPAVWYLRNTTVTLGTAPASNRYLGMFFEDVNGANLGYAAFQANRNGYNSIVFNLTNSDGTNTYTGGFRCTASPAGAYSLFPEVDGCDLGLSTNKWKTFNGINPGALSLPKTENGRYSLTELSSIIDTDSWVLDGRQIIIAANLVITGWLYVSIACGTDGYVALSTGGYGYPNCFYKVTGTPVGGYASAMIPIVSGIAVALYLKGTSLIHARYYPAAGNV